MAYIFVLVFACVTCSFVNAKLSAFIAMVFCGRAGPLLLSEKVGCFSQWFFAVNLFAARFIEKWVALGTLFFC